MMTNPVDCKIYFGDPTLNRRKLFEEALILSKHGKVLYITSKEFDELPQLSEDLNALNKHYMKMISFLYVRNLDSLVESLSTLPDWQSVPSTIILDNLPEFCGKNNLQSACSVTAFLLDTVQSCYRCLNTSSRLYISVPSAAGKDYYNVLSELYST